MFKKRDAAIGFIFVTLLIDVMGIGIISALLTLMGNLLADIGYALADPRIRYD